MTKLKGSINHRENGTFTVVSEPRWNAAKGKKARVSLGTFTTEKGAERRLLEYNLGLHQSSVTRPEHELLGTTLEDFLDDWKDHLRKEQRRSDIERATMVDYIRVTCLHIVPYIGHLKIGDLTPAILRGWVLDLGDNGAGDRTIQKATRTLHRAFGDTGLSINPAKLPRRLRPRVGTKRKKHPTSAEIAEFLDHIGTCDAAYGSAFAALWWVAATTGMRRGELAGLAWPNVDWDAATITIEQTIQHDGSALYVKGPKSSNGYRTIGIDPRTMETLRRYRRSTIRKRVAAGSEFIMEPLGHDWVFRRDGTGSPLPPQLISRAFTREWSHAGLRRGPSLHGLRHSHGSELILAGIPITQVAAHIGDHPHTLMLTYAHDLDAPARRDAISEAVASFY